jgi:hypothetical protein
MGYTSAQMGPHANTHNWKNDPSLWDTLAHRSDHIREDWRYDIGSAAVSVK